MLNAAATATDPLAGSLLVHATSLIAWVGACMLAGLVAHHYLSRLGTVAARRAPARREARPGLRCQRRPDRPAPAGRHRHQVPREDPQGGPGRHPPRPSSSTTRRPSRWPGWRPTARSPAIWTAPRSPAPCSPSRSATPLLKGRPVVDLRYAGRYRLDGRRRHLGCALPPHAPAFRQSRSLVLLPLLSRNRLVGVLLLRDDRPSTVDPGAAPAADRPDPLPGGRAPQRVLRRRGRGPRRARRRSSIGWSATPTPATITRP